ncbi:hypothetical protein [Demequina iriomotensis]|uniref:hypothetical protein n=1 Tax=Demequina iriomotensis TaxID=1536641 RepID=UPI000782EA74|nr:hypothetical protein [Demequina iriomotensis]
MSSSTLAARIVPGIATLGLAAGAVLIPNAAFAAPSGPIAGCDHVKGQPSALLTSGPHPELCSAAEAITVPEAVHQINPELINFDPDAVVPTTPMAEAQGTPEPVAVPETVTEAVPPVLPQAVPTVDAPQTVSFGGTAVGLATATHLVEAAVARGDLTVSFGGTAVGVQSAIAILRAAGVVLAPEPVRQLEPDTRPRTVAEDTVTEESPAAVVDPTPLVQGTPEPLPVQETVTVAVPPVLPQAMPDATSLVEVAPVPQTVITNDAVPSLRPEPTPLVQGTPTPIAVDADAVATDAPIVTSESVTGDAGAVVTDAEPVLTSAAADSGAPHAVTPIESLSFTGVDGSTLALGGAGIGAILLGAGLLAVRRVKA